MYDCIMSPVNYGGIMLKNRVIFAPTTLGLPRDELLDKIQKIARGGCAMIIIGDVPAVRFGTQPFLYEPEGFRYYQRLAQTVRRENCKICAQLYLPDSVADPCGEEKELRRLDRVELPGYLSALPAQKLRAYALSFAQAAQLAQAAGFDMVQVLGDQMLGSFCSAVFNTRTDLYGGSVENRLRLAQECVRSIRAHLPTLPIDYKITVRQENPHYGNAGVLQEELSVAVPILQAAGVTSFHVTLANHGQLNDVIPPRRHPYFGGEGCFLKFCDELRKYTTLPLCGVGGLTNPDFIERQLKSSRVCCVAMSRQLIADPNWVRKAASGKGNTIRRCVRCNGRCIRGMLDRSGVYCMYET